MERYFAQYALHEQEILSRKESVDKVLALVPDDIFFTVLCVFREPLRYNKWFMSEKTNKPAFSFLTLTQLLHVRKELQQDFQQEKKPEIRWKFIKDQAAKKQVGDSVHVP